MSKDFYGPHGYKDDDGQEMFAHKVAVTPLGGGLT